MNTRTEPIAQARTMYRVVQMGARAFGALNERSQVAFTERTLAGQMVAKFYNGEMIRDLGTLGGPDAVAAAVNNLEQIAGYSNVDASGLNHAFRWTAASGMVDLGTIRGAPESRASDINAMGEVVGLVSFTDGRLPRAVLWRTAARPIDLGLDRGVSPVLLINDMGQVMGNTIDENGRSMAFLWTRAAGVIPLRAPDIIDSEARDINASGQITGTFSAPGIGPAPFLWTPGKEFLHLFEQNAFPFALNNSGMVVGVLMDQVAFVWTRADGMLNIGSLGGGFSNAYDVNNHGEVVGQAATADSLHAFYWTRADGMIDLNDRLVPPSPGVELSIAMQINDNGSILAQTTTDVLVLLVPFPAVP